jgi:hypothetical protein
VSCTAGAGLRIPVCATRNAVPGLRDGGTRSPVFSFVSFLCDRGQRKETRALGAGLTILFPLFLIIDLIRPVGGWQPLFTLLQLQKPLPYFFASDVGHFLLCQLNVLHIKATFCGNSAKAPPVDALWPFTFGISGHGHS